MPQLSRSERLKKDLGLFDVYAIATGATLSSGFFLLPGLAAASAGASFPLSYLLAAIVLTPGLLSKAELTTAMPRAGGIYYFLDRSMGPLMGTIGGLGTWIALVLKSAFALIGVGAYLGLFFPETNFVPIAGGLAVVFGGLNLIGAKKSTSFQAVMVIGLLVLLTVFSGMGLVHVRAGNLSHIFAAEGGSIVATAGLVVVSYMGLTKVASVAEEVRNPDRNIPLGMFLAFGTVLLLYFVGTIVMLGVAGVDVLAADGGLLTPGATVAEMFLGPWGAILMAVAAVLAFSSVANAGILSASRYPLAMGRDNLLPRPFRFISKKRTPTVSVYVTVGLILLFVVLFDPTKIAKLAGAFKLLMFSLACISVIVMRESRIESYDPGYKAPLYPWLQVAGIVAPIWMIAYMGLLPVAFTLGLILFGIIWYVYYARDRVARGGAIYHVFERLGRRRYEGLDRELRHILKEKGLRVEDPFDQTVARANVIDLATSERFEDVVHMAADLFEHRVPGTTDELAEEFLKGTAIGATPVTHGVALPHMRREQLMQAEMVLVRAGEGVVVPPDEFHEDDEDQLVHALFFLISPDGDPGQHLRILAQIAERVDDEGFMEAWLSATDDQSLREILLRDDRFVTVRVETDGPTQAYIGKSLSDLRLPEGALVALIRRGSEVIVPHGSFTIDEGDRLTIIGDPETIRQLEDAFFEIKR